MSESIAGKGDQRRPKQVSTKKFNDNWDLIFQKKESKDNKK